MTDPNDSRVDEVLGRLDRIEAALEPPPPEPSMNDALRAGFALLEGHSQDGLARMGIAAADPFPLTLGEPAAAAEPAPRPEPGEPGWRSPDLGQGVRGRSGDEAPGMNQILRAVVSLGYIGPSD